MPDHHPYKTWMIRRGLDEQAVVEQLAARCQRKTSVPYLNHILARRKKPSWDYAEDLSSLSANDRGRRAVSVDEIMRFARTARSGEAA